MHRIVYPVTRLQPIIEYSNKNNTMENLISLFKICIVGIICPLASCAQTSSHDVVVGTIDSAYVASKIVYFNIEDGKITGDGSVLWNRMINRSQFIMLGERHGSVQMGALTNALIPILSEAEFNSFAMEIGPHSAKTLARLSSPASATMDNLNAFNNKYYVASFDGDPMPFCSGIEDALFLQTAAEYKMEFWGLDQEYYTSSLFLADELLETTKGSQDYEAISILKDAALAKMLEWYQTDEDSEEDVDAFSAMLEEEAIIAFFDATSLNEYGAEILKHLKISWDIYSRWRRGSHDDRISYMRNNFMEMYDERSQNDMLPKVFLKFGQMHATQTASYGTYDLGHLVNELARNNGTQSANINSWTRFYEEDGIVEDYYTTHANWFRRLEAFIAQGRNDEWTIIDLGSIRDDVATGRISLPTDGSIHKIKKLIEGYDYQLILPLDHEVTPNR